MQAFARTPPLAGSIALIWTDATVVRFRLMVALFHGSQVPTLRTLYQKSRRARLPGKGLFSNLDMD